jgi:hypothetical protein
LLKTVYIAKKYFRKQDANDAAEEEFAIQEKHVRWKPP